MRNISSGDAPRRVGRRRLILSALGGAAALGMATLGGTAWCRRSSASRETSVTRTGWALGSNVSLTVVGLAPTRAAGALDAAFAELETLEQVMSLYRPASQVCRLNREGRLDDPHPLLVQVLRTAGEFSQKSGGAFDITVQPLWDLYASAKRAGRLPEPSAVALARERVDWQRVEVSQRQILLRGNGTAITLNGIAQGFATDRVLATLRAHGVEQALINAGEISSLGQRSAGDAWTVGVQHPREAEAYVAVAELDGRSLAISGDYETTFTADFRKNHIFDPRTGDSPEELASVSIVAPTACQADALSTAAMVLGVEGALRLIRHLPQVDAVFVRKDGSVRQTPGFPDAHPSGAGILPAMTG